MTMGTESLGYRTYIERTLTLRDFQDIFWVSYILSSYFLPSEGSSFVAIGSNIRSVATVGVF